METQEKNNIQPAMCSSDAIECLEKLIESPIEEGYFRDSNYLSETLGDIAGYIYTEVDRIAEEVDKKKNISEYRLKIIQDKTLKILALSRILSERILNEHTINIESLKYFYEESKKK